MTPSFRLTRRTFARHLLAAGTLAVSGVRGHAAVDARRPAIGTDVFVTARDSGRVVAIDPDTSTIVGTIDAGFPVRDLAVSPLLRLLVASDGDAHLRVIDPASGTAATLALDLAPQRIQISPLGTRIEAADFSSGAVAFIDLIALHETARVTGLGPIQDAMFGSDGTQFYVAGVGRDGLTVIDVLRGQVVRQSSGSSAGPFAAVARAPNGRDGFAAYAKARLVDKLDLKGGAPIASLPVGNDTPTISVTGTGRYLLLPDNSSQRLVIAATDPLQISAIVAGPAEMTRAYSAWFDMVAFVASATEPKLIVYDLDHLREAGAIALAGIPAAGAVTPDGAKLFLPIPEAGVVQVVDAQRRQLAATIPIGAPPALLAVAGSYGLCH